MLFSISVHKAAKLKPSLLFGRVLGLWVWKKLVWVGHDRGLGGSQRWVGNYCFLLIRRVGMPRKFISQNQKEALFLIWCMHKLWNSPDGVKGKIINSSKSILTHLWKKKKGHLDLLNSLTQMWSLAQETLSPRYLAAGRIQWEKDHCIFALSFPKPLLILGCIHSTGLGGPLGPVPDICFDSRSNISLRALKWLVWSQVQHWYLTSWAKRFFNYLVRSCS